MCKRGKSGWHTHKEEDMCKFGCNHVCGVKRICVSLGTMDDIHVRNNYTVIVMWKINDRGKEEIYEGSYWNR